MSTSLYSIPQFFGMKSGTADNLVPTGYASVAKNIDVTDGALQTLIGALPYPKKVLSDLYDPASVIPMPSIPSLMWQDEATADVYFVGGDTVYQVNSETAFPAFALSASESHLLGSVVWARVHKTKINGAPVAILLPDYYNTLTPYSFYNPQCPVVVQDDGRHVRTFGSGMFLTSDQITEVTTGQDSVITGVKIGRAMTTDEIARCKYAGVYVMEDEDEELDYTAAYVSDVQVSGSVTTIVFKSSLPAASVSVGDWVKVRGGLSNKAVTLMAEFGGRLFAAGDENEPNRLYWSCLPGDGRTIEDWSADDASPDTGGGYVVVGDTSVITALFAYGNQLLIWKSEELWRLYGSTPSQFTLERVFKGSQGHAWVQAHDTVADVNGVPYWVNDLGVWYYDGNTPQRVDVDRTITTYIRNGRDSAIRCADYGENLFGVLGGVRQCIYQDGNLFILTGERSYWAGPEYETSKTTFCVFNLADRSLNVIVSDRAKVINIAATPRGILYALLERQDTGVEYGSWFLLLRGMNTEQYRNVLDDGDDRWEDTLHDLGVIDWSIQTAAVRGDREGVTKLDVSAAWESNDLSFGAVSYRKRLRRIGLDVTGPIKVIVKTPEGAKVEQELNTTDVRARRFEWVQIDMPYECTFRIRFESINGNPFRIHNGVDFSIEMMQRN